MSPQAGFVLLDKIIPRLKAAIPRTIHAVGCEDVEELVQDGIAIAAKMLHSVELAGKQVTPGNIAYYTIQLLKSGRRSVGNSKTDVLASATQLHGRTQTTSFDLEIPDADSLNDNLTLNDVISNDREDPATLGARNVDWATFCERQPARNQAILFCLATEGNLQDVARRYGVSRSSIQKNKNRLADEVREFMGPDILQECVRTPRWRDNLHVNRERMAWKRGVSDSKPKVA